MNVLAIVFFVVVGLVILAISTHFCNLYLPRKYQLYYTDRYGTLKCWTGKIPMVMQLGIEDAIDKYGKPSNVSMDLNGTVMYLSIPAKKGWYQYNVYRDGHCSSGHGYDKHNNARAASQWINGMVTYYDQE